MTNSSLSRVVALVRTTLGTHFLHWGVMACAAILFAAPSYALKPLPTPTLSASSVTATSVALAWTDPYGSEINWTVERAASSAGPFTVLATLAAGTKSYVDTTMGSGLRYYRVGYLTSSRGRKYSNTLQVNVPAAADTSAPTVAVSAPTSGSVVKGPVVFSANASDNLGVSRVEFYVDGVLMGTDTASPFSVTASVADGAHAVTAKAFDTAGNSAASASVTFSVDNTAPTVPSGVTATAPAYNQVNVSWYASSDVSGVTSYRVYRGATLIATVSGTTCTDAAVAGGSSYCYTVSALDSAGNVSAASALACLTTPSAPDTTAPSVPVVSAAAASCSQINVSWIASSDTGSGVLRYNVYRNGALWRQVAVPATSTSDATVSASTSYTYAVSATDNAGNTSATSTAAGAATPACADTTAPPVPSTPSLALNSCSQITVSWSAVTDAGGSGLRGYSLYRNGVFLREVLAPATSSVDSGLAASMTYSYAVKATDNAGNVSALSGSASLNTGTCPDATAPNVPANVVASAAGCQSNVISWTASTDTGGSGLKGYRVLRNGTNYGFVPAPTTAAADIAVSSGVTYTYAVCAQDNAGNESALSATASATAQACNQLPVAVPRVAQSATVGTSVTFDGSASYDPDGTIASYAWKFGDGATASGAVVSHAYAAAGTFTTTLTVTDNSGAVASASVIVTVTSPSGGSSTPWILQIGSALYDRGYSIATGPDNSLVVGGLMNSATAINKYTSDGTLLWSRAMSGGPSTVWSLAVDTQGNIIAAGCFSVVLYAGGTNLVSAGSGDMFVAKYRPDGAHVWSKAIGGLKDDFAKSVAVDAAGNVVVCGSVHGAVNLGGGVTSGGDFDTDIALIKISGADGSHLWSKRFGSATDDLCGGVAVDSQGNVLMSGSFNDVVNFGGGPLTSAGGGDLFVVKYLPDGTHVWSKRFGNALLDTGSAIAADGSGNVIVTGIFHGSVDFGGGILTSLGSGDCYVLKLSPSGAYTWSRRFGGNNPYFDDKANGLAVDGSGNIAVVGSSLGTGDFMTSILTNLGGSDIFLVKLSPAGAGVWSRGFGGSDIDEGMAIATDSTGAVLSTGRFCGTVDFSGVSKTSFAYDDMFVLKLAP